MKGERTRRSKRTHQAPSSWPPCCSGSAVAGKLINAGGWDRVVSAHAPPGKESGTRALIRETVSHLKDLPRYRQILATLVRYGYQDVVGALHLDGLVRPFERAALGDDVPPQDRARRLRMVCEDLGPTFVKLGQVLSTRPDLLPEAYTTSFPPFATTSVPSRTRRPRRS